MRSFLSAALSITIFLCCYDSKHRNDFVTSFWQIDKNIDCSGVSFVQSQANDSTIQKLPTTNKKENVVTEHSGKYKMAAAIADQNRTSSKAVELTLEYIALQLPRSFSPQ